MQKTVLIGLDAAEWEIILPLVNAGMMPGIKSLIDQGCSGQIKTLQPAFSPLLWTSVATGKLADKHNILSFTEPDESGTSVRPIRNTSRKSLALWNILQGQGYKCNVIGWWPSFPAEPISGLMVSHHFFKQNETAPDAHQPGMVWPEAMWETVSKLRVKPSDISAEEVKVFVPEAEKVNQDKDGSLQLIQQLMAESMSVFRTSLWAIENTTWDFTALYFNELDVFSHHFMKFHPPQMEGIPGELYQLYYNVITAAYTMFDAMLVKLIRTIPPDAAVILLSDHGFLTGDKRIKRMPDFTAAIAQEHGASGIFCIKGPGIRQNETVYGASLLDITPTVLELFGLPCGADMDGKVLQSVFDRAVQSNTIESWENNAGNVGTHPPGLMMNTFEEAAALQQLIDLGYVESSGSDAEEQVRQAIRERTYNLSIVYASSGRVEAARLLVEKLYEQDMVDLRYNLDLIQYSIYAGRCGRAREVLNNLKKFDITGLPDFDYLQGKILIAEGQKEEALRCFLQALSNAPEFPELLLDTARAYAAMGHTDKAIAAFKKILLRQPDCIEANLSLAIIMNKLEDYEAATGFALDVLKSDNSNAFAHYLIGIALYRLEEYEASARALETCLLLQPGLSRARNLLLRIYKDPLPDKNKYASHYEEFIQSRLGEIVVVSGLPRSGTSMMMQLLSNGGMPVLMDEAIPADIHNPKGYFEYAPVKNSKHDISWLEQADGKAVKVITQLLPSLRMKYRLKVILMNRDLEEVILSQQAMLNTRGKHTATYDMGLKDAFARHQQALVDWAGQQSNVSLLQVNYKDVIEAPENASRKINDFLGGFLDEQKMSTAVDVNLYRIRHYEHDTKSI